MRAGGGEELFTDGLSFAPGAEEVADQVLVSDTEVTSVTNYHPLVPSNSHI
jgi:hypothetical protein